MMHLRRQGVRELAQSQLVGPGLPQMCLGSGLSKLHKQQRVQDSICMQNERGGALRWRVVHVPSPLGGCECSAR
jgi:hypothetical protein